MIFLSLFYCSFVFSLSLSRKNGYNNAPRVYVPCVQVFSSCFGCLRDKAIFHKSNVSSSTLFYYSHKINPSVLYPPNPIAGNTQEHEGSLREASCTHHYLNKSHLASRMMVRQDFSLSIGIDVEINLRGCNRAVSQNMLDIGNVDVLFKQKRGKRVTESMRRHMLFYATVIC